MRNRVAQSKVGAANDYIENRNFSLNLTDITIKTSIDLIILSASGFDLKLIYNEMKNHYQLVKDNQLLKGKYQRKAVYENYYGSVDLLYKPRFQDAYMKNRFLLIFHQPNQQMMSQLDNIFWKLSIEPVVSKIELAWDFYGESVWILKEFLEQHLFLKYQRSPSNKYKDTYYTNNLRRSVKGVRLYPRPKDTDNKNFIRLELEIHRPKIRELKIRFPIRADDLNLDFSKFFEFRKFDWNKLIAYLVKKHWKQIGNINSKRPGCGDLLLRQFESSCISWASMPLMSAVEDLRTRPYGIQNFSRFFVPMDSLNHLIKDSAVKQRFQIFANRGG